jgi:hypothetical protein
MLKLVRKDATIIFILLAFVFAYFYQNGGWNGNSRFDMIFAIVREGRLSIDTYHNKAATETGDKAYFNGHYYSDKAIGPSILGTVFYAALYLMKLTIHHPSQANVMQILTFLVIGLPSAFAGSLIYVFSFYLSKSRFRAFVVTLAITLGTMYLPYSVTFFSHQFTSSLLFSAFFMIFLLKEKQETWKKGYLCLIGLLLGWALISEYPSAIIILPLVIYYFSIALRNKNNRNMQVILLPALSAIIPISLQLLYNKLCFGNFLSNAYTYSDSAYYRSSMQQGLMGIHWPDLSVLFYTTFHPLMGLFWESPVLLLSVVGAWVVFIEHRFREEAILAAWIICSYIVIMSGYFNWWGGYALGARHIIPVLPFFSFFLSFTPKRFNWLLAGLSLVSIGQMLIAAASSVLIPDKVVLQIKTLGFFEYSNIYSYCLKQLMEGNFTQNLGNRFLGLTSWSSFIPLVVVTAGFTCLFFLKGLYGNKGVKTTTG